MKLQSHKPNRPFLLLINQVYRLHPVHAAGGKAPVRDPDPEGHLRQDQEERVPHSIQSRTPGKKSYH